MTQEQAARCAWHFNADNLTLTTYAGEYPYEIDLEEMRNPGVVLDTIVQISHKTWATPKVVGELVAAMDDLLNFQRRMCGFGVMHRLPKKRIREAIKCELEEKAYRQEWNAVARRIEAEIEAERGK